MWKFVILVVVLQVACQRSVQSGCKFNVSFRRLKSPLINRLKIMSIAEEYIKQCSKADPELTGCLKGALHHLRPYLAKGIEEIQVSTSFP